MELIGHRKNPPWTLLEALLALGFVYLITNSVGFIIKILDISWSLLSSFVFASILQAACIVLLVYYFAIIKHGGNSKSLGLRAGEIKKYFVEGIFSGTVIFSLVIASSMLVERIIKAPAELQPFARLVVQTNSLPQLLLLFLLGVVVAPFTEELYFRGFLYPAMRARIGVPLAILVTAAIFGLLHFDLVRFLPLAVGGAGLAWLYERTGSLYVPIVAHGFWNFIMLVILVILK